MRIVFMGTPDFAVPSLTTLSEAGHNIAAVYTQPPRPAGRGKQPRLSPVAAKAESLGLAVRSPESLRSADEQAAFAALGAELAVVVAYGLILPEPILAAFPRGCLNVHASLLPRWRGAAPIQRAIMEGDAGTGVCIMQVECELDAGPVLLREGVAIGETETAGELGGRLAELGARLISEAIKEIDALVPELQPHSGVSYARKIGKSEARVDWSRPAPEVDRLIRGLSPFPGAWTEIRGERLKLLRSSLGPGSGSPGEVLDDDLTVACGEGAVRIIEAQRAGRGAGPAETVLRGFPVSAGTRLS